MNKIPNELMALPQWVVWKTVVRGTQKTKLPFQPSGKAAKSNDPSTWTTFEMVNRAAACGQKYDGPGFMFSPDDPFVGVDLDGCRDPKNGGVSDWAKEIIQHFDSYSEVSPSQTGVKIFVKGESTGGDGCTNPYF